MKTGGRVGFLRQFGVTEVDKKVKEYQDMGGLEN